MRSVAALITAPAGSADMGNWNEDRFAWVLDPLTSVVLPQCVVVGWFCCTQPTSSAVMVVVAAAASRILSESTARAAMSTAAVAISFLNHSSQTI